MFWRFAAAARLASASDSNASCSAGKMNFTRISNFSLLLHFATNTCGHITHAPTAAAATATISTAPAAASLARPIIG